MQTRRPFPSKMRSDFTVWWFLSKYFWLWQCNSTFVTQPAMKNYSKLLLVLIIVLCFFLHQVKTATRGPWESCPGSPSGFTRHIPLVPRDSDSKSSPLGIRRSLSADSAFLRCRIRRAVPLFPKSPQWSRASSVPRGSGESSSSASEALRPAQIEASAWFAHLQKLFSDIRHSNTGRLDRLINLERELSSASSDELKSVAAQIKDIRETYDHDYKSIDSLMRFIESTFDEKFPGKGDGRCPSLSDSFDFWALPWTLRLPWWLFRLPVPIRIIIQVCCIISIYISNRKIAIWFHFAFSCAYVWVGGNQLSAYYQFSCWEWNRDADSASPIGLRLKTMK